MEQQDTPRYQTFTLRNFRTLPQMAGLTEEELFAIEVVGQVLPFKVNNYVVEELVDWDNFRDDPVFHLTFPQKAMLAPHHFEQVARALQQQVSRDEMKALVNEIRLQLNPHPAGQMEYNVPVLEGTRLTGIQHKYRETMLFFPSNGQTCHAYCTFCFRWPQFVGMNELKFAMRETDLMVQYLQEHPEITDVLFTGGDPMIMKARHLEAYLLPLLELPSVRTIRIGSKVLGYWPHRFLTDPDAQEVLDLFRKVVDSGRQLAFMAHFNHLAELLPEAQQAAARAIRATGAQIRTQSPIMRHINDEAAIWRDMWKEQVRQGMVPYYMFLARDTGAQEYFSVPLLRAWEIFRDAYQQVSGICRTVRGPSMSAGPGKVQVLGPVTVRGERAIALRFVQGRNPDWVQQPFFAAYDEEATWLDQLQPAFGEEHFFFEEASHPVVEAGLN